MGKISVKELRASTGMSQSRFAEYFDMSVRSLQEWEQGKRTPLEAFVRLMEYKLRQEGLLGELPVERDAENDGGKEFRDALQRHLWRCELEYRASELPNGSCVDWLAPYCNTTQEIASFLQELGLKVERIVDEEDCAGEIHRWVVTTGGVVVYVNRLENNLNGLVAGIG